MSDVLGTVTRGAGDKVVATLVLVGKLEKKKVDWDELVEVLRPLLKRYGVEVKECKGPMVAVSRSRPTTKKRKK